MKIQISKTIITWSTRLWSLDYWAFNPYYALSIPQNHTAQMILPLVISIHIWMDSFQQLIWNHQNLNEVANHLASAICNFGVQSIYGQTHKCMDHVHVSSIFYAEDKH